MSLQNVEGLISVIIPVYNGAAYLEETIASVLAQTYSNFELIMIDDGSVDQSPEIMRAWAARDQRIKSIFQPHGGIARARNEGIKAAQGEYIAYLDQDDFAVPERLTVQLAYIRQNELDICGGWAQQFGDQHEVMTFPESPAALQIELLFYCAILQPTIMLRATVAKKHLNDETANFLDYELWSRLAPEYRMGNMPYILIKYRRHAGQTSTRQATAFRADRIKYRKRYFNALFPQADPVELQHLERIAEKEKSTNIVQLSQTGAWLAALAQSGEQAIRDSLGRKWWGACRRSSNLGYGVFQVYRQYAHVFPTVEREQRFVLWITCLLRLDREAVLYRNLAEFKHNMTSLMRRRCS
jgi:glycosyltransferase involved in cell wall biosynthesis